MTRKRDAHRRKRWNKARRQLKARLGWVPAFMLTGNKRRGFRPVRMRWVYVFTESLHVDSAMAG